MSAEHTVQSHNVHRDDESADYATTENGNAENGNAGNTTDGDGGVKHPGHAEEEGQEEIDFNAMMQWRQNCRGSPR